MNKELIKKFELQIDGNSFIEEIIDKSDERFKRARVKFKNGYELSIVAGSFPSVYGTEGETFEIAPMNENNEFEPSLLDDEDSGDDICGYCDAEKVKYYINKIGNMDRK